MLLGRFSLLLSAKYWTSDLLVTLAATSSLIIYQVNSWARGTERFHHANHTQTQRVIFGQEKHSMSDATKNYILYYLILPLSLSLSFLSHLHSLLLCVCKILSVSLTHPYILCLALYKISVTRFGEILQLCAKILKLLAILKGLICLSRPVSTDLI